MLPRYLALAEAMMREADRVATEATQFLRTSGYQMTVRDRVLTALACKADGTFRALVEDCRAERGEDMHHLKTLTEVFIYFHATSDDSTDRTARGVLAERVAGEHAKRLRELEPGSEELLDWESLRAELRREAIEVRDLAQLAGPLTSPLRSWYARVYRLACQSAHIGDLLTWMPSDDDEVMVGDAARSAIGPLQASTAIYYAIEIMLGLFETIGAGNQAGLQIDTRPVRADMSAIRESTKETS
jgi:hypothetical protein